MRELWLELLILHDRERADLTRRVQLAFAVEFMARQKVLSGASIQLLLEPRRPSGQQRPEEQRAVLYQLSAKLGTPLQRLRRGQDGTWIAA